MPKSFSSIYFRCQRFSPERSLTGKHEYLSTEIVDFEGRQVSTSVYKVDDPTVRYDGLKPSDFSFENQAAVGVEKRPVMCSLQRGEIESQIEKANSLYNE